MKEFIKKQQFNYIKRCLNDLNNAFRNCVDVNIVETTKLCCQDKIVSQFESLSLAQREILNIGKINEPLQIEPFLKAMDKYVYGMNKLTKADINKVFKKEKKLKLPDLDSDAKVVYTGWIDESTKKLFIIYGANALSNIIIKGFTFSQIQNDIYILILFVVILSTLNILCLKKYRKI